MSKDKAESSKPAPKPTPKPAPAPQSIIRPQNDISVNSQNPGEHPTKMTKE